MFPPNIDSRWGGEGEEGKEEGDGEEGKEEEEEEGEGKKEDLAARWGRYGGMVDDEEGGSLRDSFEGGNDGRKVG